MQAIDPTTKSPPGRASPENTVRSLVRAMGMLDRVMQPHFARFGISGAQWGVLRALDRARQEGLPSLRLTDLGARLLVRPPSVTSLIDRLLRMGLVSRDNSQTDLRVKEVSLTAKGQQVIDRVLEVHQAQIDRILGGLESAEQVELQRLLRRLGDHLEHLVEEGEVSVVV